ncbi:MAG: hypothetical protein ACI83P_002395 [Janthinobacterium sp.]|jgi:uncharacterized protein (DUF2062 family)
MLIRWLSQHFPTPQRLKDSRFLKPFARYLHDHSLWQFNRRAVAGGATVGLFFGILFPFLQVFLAAFAAIVLRVNLPVAAFCTLVTNPLTFPAIYYFAYRLGAVLTGAASMPPAEEIDAGIERVVALQPDTVVGWLPRLVDWVQTVGLPLALGLCVMATVAALLCYVTVNMVWTLRVRLGWRAQALETAPML